MAIKEQGRKVDNTNYMAYVGPPEQFDLMGATQFRLLTSLGLRAHHDLLDFGCGSLRAGRLFLSYLDKNRYYGIDPNKWLITEAIKNQVGNDAIRIKGPQFSYNSDFATDVFSKKFNYIIAQSIFSHAGSELVDKCLHNFKESLLPEGIIAATFREGALDFEGRGWVHAGNDNYNFHPPSKRELIRYTPSTIQKFAKNAGLHCVRIPWYHPRQAWYVMALDEKRIPNCRQLEYLSGAILFDSDFAESTKIE